MSYPSEKCLRYLESQYKKYLRSEPEVDTTKFYQELEPPKKIDCLHNFSGYGIQKDSISPFYKTTSSEYGWYTPSQHTVPQRYFPRTQRFSSHLAQCGMYRNYSLNTVMDKRFY